MAPSSSKKRKQGTTEDEKENGVKRRATGRRQFLRTDGNDWVPNLRTMVKARAGQLPIVTIPEEVNEIFRITAVNALDEFARLIRSEIWTCRDARRYRNDILARAYRNMPGVQVDKLNIKTLIADREALVNHMKLDPRHLPGEDDVEGGESDGQGESEEEKGNEKEHQENLRQRLRIPFAFSKFSDEMKGLISARSTDKDAVKSFLQKAQILYTMILEAIAGDMVGFKKESKSSKKGGSSASRRYRLDLEAYEGLKNGDYGRLAPNVVLPWTSVDIEDDPFNLSMKV